jgi:hypothetical protein
LAHGKPVITANKELLANVGHDLWAQSDAAGVDLLFEAAVAGTIFVKKFLVGATQVQIADHGTKSLLLIIRWKTYVRFLVRQCGG